MDAEAVQKENNNPDISKIEIPVRRRRCNNPAELKEVNTEMKKAFTTLNNVLDNKQKKEQNEDECDLYGKLLAKKLRQYSETERDELMYEIDGLLLKKRKATNRLYASVSSPSQIIISTNRPSTGLSNYSGSLSHGLVNSSRSSSRLSSYSVASPPQVIQNDNCPVSPPYISIPHHASTLNNMPYQNPPPFTDVPVVYPSNQLSTSISNTQHDIIYKAFSNASATENEQH